MLTVAVILFLVAALGGIIMALSIFRGTFPRVGLAIAHGVLAATGLVLALLVAYTRSATPALTYGVALLVLAALGGFFLLSFHIRGKVHPRPAVVLHALVAVAGVACLALVLLR